jgi:hypothetical protein
VVNGLVALIEQRVARHPARSIPTELLAGIVRHWKDAGDPFRLSFVPNVTRGKGVICEGRIGYQGLIHPGWEDIEPNLVIAFVALTITKASAQVTVKVQHAFSFHSLARFYERTGMRGDADVIAAMASALIFDPSECCPGDEVRIGNWRGVIKQRTTPQGDIQMWCARTWIE